MAEQNRIEKVKKKKTREFLLIFDKLVEITYIIQNYCAFQTL